MAIIKKEKKFISVVPSTDRFDGPSTATKAPSGPYIYLDVSVPPLDGRDIGDEITFTCKGRLESVSISKRHKGKDTHSYSIEVREMSFD